MLRQPDDVTACPHHIAACSVSLYLAVFALKLAVFGYAAVCLSRVGGAGHGDILRQQLSVTGSRLRRLPCSGGQARP